ncbi:uncharacterized protein LOC128989069 [Macrosteles quadrilineatus]|uniref:uncharacterized protein LOC128989069 n=1 Tax=Macrosteles quadrilineatus TaxID=74068 RepID=UPI0023E220F5|nr:uncharacterized protein LOC128989069 [Macrosteles quadrilineatus]
MCGPRTDAPSHLCRRTIGKPRAFPCECRCGYNYVAGAVLLSVESSIISAMWRSIIVLSVVAGLAAGSAIQRVPRERKAGFGAGLATIVGTLAILKVKAFIVTLIVFAIAAFLSRFVGLGGCLGGGEYGCGASALLSPTAHSNNYGYNYDTYTGSNTGYNYYNHKRSAKSIQGWDILDMSMEVLGLESDDCKKKFVCLADNEAIENPLLNILMRAFGSSLTKYRDLDDVSGSKSAQNCDKLYPKCARPLRRTSPEEEPSDKLPYDDKPTDKLPYTDVTSTDKVAYHDKRKIGIHR